MGETEYSYSVTAEEMVLLEWLRGAHSTRFSVINERYADGHAFNLRTIDFDAADVSGGILRGTGGTFEAAWRDRKSFVQVTTEDTPQPFSVIEGGRDA